MNSIDRGSGAGYKITDGGERRFICGGDSPDKEFGLIGTATMIDEQRRPHWDDVYKSKAADSVSWYQASPDMSLELIIDSGVGLNASIIDVGGGASILVDKLLDRGQAHVAVLDIAASGLAATRHRLGARSSAATWIVADVTTWRADSEFDLWHDRAVFHFLTSATDRDGYRMALKQGLAIGGTLILATFALDGPERCSGLPVQRYDAAGLAAEMGSAFELLDSRREAHRTPGGAVQAFTWTRFRRVA